MHGSPANGWVLFDDACGVCRHWIQYFAGTLRRRGFEIAPLQSDWVNDKLKLSPDELFQDMRVMLVDGSSIAGADGYRYLMRRIWWAYPIYLVSLIPGLRQTFNWSYRKFADNRFRISRTCRLPSAPPNRDAN
jgi:predicted DCC family thiol-disulfide oxidoreductase YuxK